MKERPDVKTVMKPSESAIIAALADLEAAIGAIPDQSAALAAIEAAIEALPDQSAALAAIEAAIEALPDQSAALAAIEAAIESDPNTKSWLTFRATGSAAIASSLAPGAAFEISSIKLHLSAAGGSNNFSVTVDSGTDPAYDIKLLDVDLTAETDLFFQFNRPEHFDAADEIDFAWANGGGKTYGLEVKYRLV